MQLFAPTVKDFYKVGHINQYPEGTNVVYSNFTPRSGKYSNTGTDRVVFAGLQYLIKDYLIDDWNDTFFNQPKEVVVNKYQRRVSNALGFKVDVSHLEKLHDLGYLPISIRALPEGSVVPYKIPFFTIENTLPEFYWVTNMLEIVLSNEIWAISTAATTYNAYRKNFLKYAIETGSPVEFIPFQGHDFSYRGMMGRHAGAATGLGALLAGSVGTDTIPAIDLAEDFYFANSDSELIGASVNATEHSVMCAGAKESEFETYKRLINDVYPEGILSIVSDTWDFWGVVTDFLPRLKDDIMKRNGKVVIRPDSGDPVKILTGYLPSEYITIGGKHYDMKYAALEPNSFPESYFVVPNAPELTQAEVDGLIKTLYDIFGGTTTSNGFKVMDEHIGAIYGDSITIQRQVEILERLKLKGFASANVVLGIGSYTYQMVTRDTHGMAMKATYVEVNGEPRPIFKDPKTDDGTKKSAKGLLMVTRIGKDFELRDEVSRNEQKRGALELVFENGIAYNQQTLQQVRDTVKSFD